MKIERRTTYDIGDRVMSRLIASKIIDKNDQRVPEKRPVSELG